MQCRRFVRHYLCSGLGPTIATALLRVRVEPLRPGTASVDGGPKPLVLTLVRAAARKAAISPTRVAGTADDHLHVALRALEDAPPILSLHGLLRTFVDVRGRPGR